MAETTGDTHQHDDVDPERDRQVDDTDDTASGEAGEVSVLGAALAEMIGTFMLLFFGVGAILAAGGADGPAQKLMIGFAFGLAILAGAYTFGHVSGAHLNPAVTIALVSSRRFPASAAVAYVIAQLLGAVLGVLAVDLLFIAGDIGTTVTAVGEESALGRALVAEFLMTFVLVMVVKGTVVDDRAEGTGAGLAIGLTVFIGHLAFLPVSGASFNPARSFGSAIVGGDWGDFWIYVVGPIAGGIAAALVYEHVLRHVRTPDIDDLPG